MGLIEFVSAKGKITVQETPDTITLLLDGVPRYRAFKDVFLTRRGHGPTKTSIRYNVVNVQEQKQVRTRVPKAEALRLMKVFLKKAMEQEGL